MPKVDTLFRVACSAGALVAAIAWLVCLAASLLLFTDRWTIRLLFEPQLVALLLFPIWGATIWVAQQKSSHAPRQLFWKLATRSCPAWLRITLKVGGVWAATWLAAYFAAVAWMPDSGLAHRRWPDDFVWCWGLAFTSATLATLSSGAIEGLQMTRCPNGHPVYSSFCADCGAATGLPVELTLLESPASRRKDQLYRLACALFAAPPLVGIALCVGAACRYVAALLPSNPHHGVPLAVLLLFPSWAATIILCSGKGSRVEGNRFFSAVTRSTPRRVWIFLTVCWCVAIPASLWPAPDSAGDHWFILVFMLFYSVAIAALTSSAVEGLALPRCPQGHLVHKPFCAACGRPAGHALW